jgi:hypothetical protein
VCQACAKSTYCKVPSLPILVYNTPATDSQHANPRSSAHSFYRTHCRRHNVRVRPILTR